MNPDTESCFINSFWDRLPDRVAINADLQIEYLEKFNGQLGRQGEGILRGERSRSNRTAQKHH